MLAEERVEMVDQEVRISSGFFLRMKNLNFVTGAGGSGGKKNSSEKRPLT